MNQKKRRPIGRRFVIHDVLRNPEPVAVFQFCTNPILAISAFLAEAKTLANTPYSA